MKKSSIWIWIVLFSLLILLAACDEFVLPSTPEQTGGTMQESAPDNGDGSEHFSETPQLGDHEHKFSEWYVLVEATCTDSGMMERVCSCGLQETQTIDAYGHREILIEAVEPTCTEQGYSEGIQCEVCYEMLQEPVMLEAFGHTYEISVVDPTCTEQGYTTFTCHCGEQYTESYVEPIGHEFTEWHVALEPTCTKEGTQQRQCVFCGLVEEQGIERIEHVYSMTVIEPTCTAQGYTEYTCISCMDRYVDLYTEALGHRFDTWYTVIASTCTREGVERRDCNHCDLYEEQPLAMVPHSYGAFITEPTCLEQGYTFFVCDCGDSYTDAYVDALGHSMSDWFEAYAPTCTENGRECRNCMRCPYMEEQLTAPLGHSYSATVTVPTCTEQGYTTHTCHCGDWYVDNYVNSTDHDFSEWYLIKEPTCEEQGRNRSTCPQCGESIEQSIPARGHSYEAHVTEPTCYDQGYTTQICSCGSSYIESYTSPLGHDMSEWFTISEPMCDEQGEMRSTCSRCAYYEQRGIEPFGHAYVATTVEPTCTEQGYTYYYCHCGAYYEDYFVAALGHEYRSYVTEPTCLSDGYTTHVCHCGSSYTDQYVSATGHQFQKVKIEPTCEEQGYINYICHCGDTYTDSYIDPLGHSFGEWYLLYAPMCMQEGEQRRDCSACHAFEQQTVPATGHAYLDEVTSPTCQSQGYTTHRCFNCGDSYVDSFTDYGDHSWGGWYTAESPSCAVDGIESRQCSVCYIYDSRTIPAYGHNYSSSVIAPETAIEICFSAALGARISFTSFASRSISTCSEGNSTPSSS